MNKKVQKINRTIAYICLGIMLLMFLSILLRLFTRQVLVERMGMNNAFTRLVFFDSARLQNETTYTEKDKIDWEALYPFKEEDLAGNAVNEISSQAVRESSAYVKFVNSLETKIEDYAGKFLMGHDAAANLAASFDNLLKWNKPVSPSDFNRIIRMNNGYLTYVQPKIESDEIDKMVDSVVDFENFLEGMGIPLLVVNTGSKVNPLDPQLSTFESQFEHTNENGDELVGKLKDKGINILDFRYEMLEDGLDWYSYYYKTDHHWTTEAGLYAASKIAERLNETCNTDFNLLLFDESNYELTKYPNIMFGGEGRMVTLANASLEDYTSVIPSFATDLTLEIVDSGEVYSGSYDEALYGMEKLEEVKAYTGSDFLTQNDAYGTIRLHNSPVAKIINNAPACNEDLKILCIQDSFSWYSTSFLSMGAGETDIIYPISFTGSIKAYVEEYKPDIVVFSFCEKAIDPLNYSNHETYFDLR